MVFFEDYIDHSKSRQPTKKLLHCLTLKDSQHERLCRLFFCLSHILASLYCSLFKSYRSFMNTLFIHRLHTTRTSPVRHHILMQTCRWQCWTNRTHRALPVWKLWNKVAGPGQNGCSLLLRTWCMHWASIVSRGARGSLKSTMNNSCINQCFYLPPFSGFKVMGYYYILFIWSSMLGKELSFI